MRTFALLSLLILTPNSVDWVHLSQQSGNCVTASLDRQYPVTLTSREARERFPSRTDVTAKAFLTPVQAGAATADTRGKGLFTASQAVYVMDNAEYSLRFIVHAPDESASLLMKPIGSFMAHLWMALNRRVERLCSKLRDEVIEVWLTRTGEPGAETFDRHIYVYDLLSDRSPFEWARELAHEYGHAVLPSPGGYLTPEPWGNGMLGERLFSRWLLHDLSTLAPGESLPFVTRENLQHYIDRQVDPLLKRHNSASPDRHILDGNDKRSMDAYSGLMLHLDRTYGSKTLFNLLEHLPSAANKSSTGADFLSAAESWLSDHPQQATLETESAVIWIPHGTAEAASKFPFRIAGVSSDQKATHRWIQDRGEWRRFSRTNTSEPQHIELKFFR